MEPTVLKIGLNNAPATLDLVGEDLRKAEGQK